MAVMKARGEKHINEILPLLEDYLNQPAPPSEGVCASVPRHRHSVAHAYKIQRTMENHRLSRC